jgi:chromosome segregation ATPase
MDAEVSAMVSQLKSMNSSLNIELMESKAATMQYERDISMLSQEIKRLNHVIIEMQKENEHNQIKSQNMMSQLQKNVVKADQEHENNMEYKIRKPQLEKNVEKAGQGNQEHQLKMENIVLKEKLEMLTKMLENFQEENEKLTKRCNTLQDALNNK